MKKTSEEEKSRIKEPDLKHLEYNPVPIKENLLLDISNLNQDINRCDEQIAFHHMEKQKQEEMKAKYVEERKKFMAELCSSLGEKAS